MQTKKISTVLNVITVLDNIVMLFGENVTNIAMKTMELIKTSIAYDDVLKQLTNMSLIRNTIFNS